MATARTKIFLTGPFQVICDDGRDATPRGTKAKALVALVVLSKNTIRSRIWLQDRLWSQSSPAQGAASLRKELSVLTKHFGAFGLTFLDVGRGNVAINLAEAEVDLFDEQLQPDRAELLEGLDVADPEFEEWLAVERQAYWDIDTGEGGPGPLGGLVPARWGRQRPAVVVEPMEVVGDTPDIAVAATSIRDELLFLLGTLSDVIELRDARRQEGPVDGYVLSGSVVGAEGLRVAAQLTSTSDQICLWTERFRFRKQDTFDAVEEIAMKVVEALQLRLRDGHWSEIWSARGTSTEVWTAFQNGRIQESHTTETGLFHAIRQYETCLQRDPDYLPAIVAIGFCRLDLIRLGMDNVPEQTLAQVDAKCVSLRAKHPTDPYCAALEAFTCNVAGKTEDACHLMRKVVDRFHSSPELLGYYAGLLGYDDQLEAEIAVYRQALALTPHPPIWIEANLAMAMALLEDKAAWQHAHNVLRVDPGSVRARVVLCMLSVAAGNQSLARRHARRILELQPGFTAKRWAWPACFKNQNHYTDVANLLSAAGL
ncbi:hypothetical protein HW561_18685 [Rhodobacteraceae bacterium B1Z28]|uniref:TolB-like protein n=1 Tax=Ruegeria haliotis TaxID=2747601 RepID=A0ABX2PUX0_9RHOB|nr:hypothetical protein [Ruegeria haliotis]NVO57828.1 hypothetical protein [Ruegeria haliotis]